MSHPDYASDAPRIRRTEDELGRDAFVDRLVSLLSKSPQESIVVGLYGGWGEGKTSVLNFVSSDLDELDDVIVMHFNPWLFPTESQLLIQFLTQVGDAVGKNVKPRYKKLSSTLSKYAGAVSYVGIPGEPIKNALLAIGQLDPEKIKADLEIALEDSEKHLVVFLDDIDRLDKSEVQNVFRLVKLVANFPRTYYVLAFDEKAVSAALRERFPGSDSASSIPFDYLEKIIQVPLNLPQPSTSRLLALLLTELEKVVPKLEHVDSRDLDRLAEVYAIGIGPGISTIRDVRRLSNAVNFSHGAVGDRVNTVDLILLESIKVLYPALYDSIRLNQAQYLKILPANFGPSESAYAQERDALKGYFSSALAEIPAASREAARAVASILLPQLRQLNENILFGYEEQELWEKQKRLCSARHFPRYFSYGLEPDDVDETELTATLRELRNRDLESDAAKHLIGLLIDKTSYAALTAIRRELEVLERDNLDALTFLLSSISGRIPDPRRGMLAELSGPFRQSTILLAELFKLMFADESMLAIGENLLDFVAKASGSIEHSTETIRRLENITDGDQLSRWPVEWIHAAHVTAVRRIEDGATQLEPDGWILDLAHTRPEALIQEWRLVGNVGTLRGHLMRSVAVNPQRSVALLEALVRESYEFAGEKRRFKNLNAEVFNLIAEIVPKDSMLKALRLATGLILAPDSAWVYWDDRGSAVTLAEQYAWYAQKTEMSTET